MATPPPFRSSSPIWTVLTKLPEHRQRGSQFEARCPAHEDARPSLSIKEGSDGRALLLCRSGCKTEAILAALGLEFSDLFERRSDGAKVRRFRAVDARGRVVAHHDRVDLPGNDKRMSWEANGKRNLGGLKLDALPLYRLPELLEAPKGSTVYVTEGEGKADILADHGLIAVGTMTGSDGNPSAETLEPLFDYRVVLWPDNDDVGRAHMERIAARLNMRKPPYWLDWQAAPPKGDAADYFEAGGTADGLAELVRPWQASATVEAAPKASRLQVIRLADVQPEAISWLWRGRLARGKATLLMGDPGLGKSLISHWIASTISRGGAWPDGGQCEQGATILFSTEDGLADTVVPRCLAAGADMTRIHAVQGVIEDPSDPVERMFALDEHLADLETLIAETGAIYVVMDPITAYLGPDVNSHKEADVRRVLGPVSLMAQRTGIVLLMVMHLNKGTGVSALYRSVGSIAFPAVARVVLGIAPDPNEEKRRLLLPIKMNIAADAQGIGYRIQTAETNVLRHANEADQPPVLCWDNEPVTVTASTALDSSGTAIEKGMKAEVKTVLIGLLPPGTRRSSRDCWDVIKKETGCASGSIVAQAKTDLGIVSAKDSFSGGWYWEMPEQSNPRARISPQDSSDSSGFLDSSGTPEASQNGKTTPEESKSDSQESMKLPKNPQESEESMIPLSRARVCPDCGRMTPGSWARYCETCQAKRKPIPDDIEELPL